MCRYAHWIRNIDFTLALSLFSPFQVYTHAAQSPKAKFWLGLCPHSCRFHPTAVVSNPDLLIYYTEKWMLSRPSFKLPSSCRDPSFFVALQLLSITVSKWWLDLGSHQGCKKPFTESLSTLEKQPTANSDYTVKSWVSIKHIQYHFRSQS